jgi:ABC-type microcin C transport system duplicated ATPase subunit YejF
MLIMLCLCFPTHLITNTITLDLKVYVNIHIIKVYCKLQMKEQLRFPVLLQMFI